MILLLALFLGFLAGLVRARRNNRPYNLPDIRLMWLVTVALFPQILAFYLPATSSLFSKEAASIALVVSQVGLLVFVWANRRTLIFWILGIGLALNFTVIVANGGLMPISPQTIARLVPEQPIEMWQEGERLGISKDVILAPEQTRFAWLSDRFITPDWYPQPTAYSLGDIIIALGVFGLLWQAGGRQPNLPANLLVGIFTTGRESKI